jgi:hypothetical protein
LGDSGVGWEVKCRVIYGLTKLSITSARRNGERRYSSTTLDLGTRWICSQLHAPTALPSGANIKIECEATDSCGSG